VLGALILSAHLLFSTGAGADGPAQSVARDVAVPDMFETSDICMGCHNGIVTGSGEDVSIGSGWRASMMANSARDPYWQAAVRRETMDHPPAAEAIENECSTCHMPMAHYRARVAKQDAQIFAHLPILPAHLAVSRDAVLAADGVGCATCHQMTAEHLGSQASFVGGFVIDSTTPWDRRVMYGPFEVDAGRARVMHSASAFLPARGEHIQESTLCASCHTLITHALDDNHQVVGDLPEQVPYLEWLHSAYSDEKSCQDCHMPVVDEPVAVSSVMGLPRDGVNRHAFRGGNFLVPRMFSRFGSELGVEATPAELDAAVNRTLNHLKTRAAVVRIDRVRIAQARLEADVSVSNLAGHKLPTAYPSRRVWLHMTVADGDGRIVFESGALRPDGSIEGNDNDALGTSYEPHHRTISRPDQVQVYEAVMVDPQGDLTTGLTSGLRYVKDNRILPRGFDKETAAPDVAVQGLAKLDSDFAAQADRIRFSVNIDPAGGPFSITAELWYQPVGYRWAQNLRDYDAMETQRFADYYDSMSGASAVQLAADTWAGSGR
jgi:hypothetical protein